MTKHNTMLPTLFREALLTAGIRAVDDWWMTLDEPSRQDALALWESEFNGSDSRPVARVEAQFIEDEEDAKGALWHDDFYEYLVNHELFPERRMRTFHICTRHPMAAAAVRSGFIPKNFTCPYENANCPMRNLLSLSPGKSVRLRISMAG